MSNFRLLKQDTINWVFYNRNLFHTILKDGILRSGCQHGSGESLFWVTDCPNFLLYTHMPERKKASLPPFIQTTNPIMKPLPSWSNYVPIAPPPNTIIRGIVFQIEFGREHKQAVHNNKKQWKIRSLYQSKG